MKTCILRGVPSSLRQGGWWLDPFTRKRPSPDQPCAAQNPNRYALHAMLLGGLIAVSQLPPLSDRSALSPALQHTACETIDSLGFHAVHDLRSFGTMSQLTKPL